MPEDTRRTTEAPERRLADPSSWPSEFEAVAALRAYCRDPVVTRTT